MTGSELPLIKTPKALDVYNIPFWGEGYFDVNDKGHLQVRPQGSDNPSKIDLVELCALLQQEGIRLPALVRFPELLKHRVRCIRQAFLSSIERYAYQGDYQLLYPIKVNQQRPVVEAIMAGQTEEGQCVGLEAGSKPELMAILALCQGKNATIVCNGYKDKHFIRLALMAEKLGHRVYLVVEKRSELQKILSESSKLKVTPRLGVRARLASVGKGNWQNTGGEKSKFGLNASQLLQLIEDLKQARALPSLQLLHFHLGSQIASIQDIQRGLKECGRFYVELHRLGVSIDTVDVGGGLGVDYEGTGSRSACSMNYDLQEYANAVVSAFAQAARDADLSEPLLLSESGRALSAHHALLLANVVEAETYSSEDRHNSLQVPQNDEQKPQNPVSASSAPDKIVPANTVPAVVQQLAEVLQRLNSEASMDASMCLPGQSGYRHNASGRQIMEAYHQVQAAYQQAQEAFNSQALGLKERALVERYYHEASEALLKRLDPNVKRHREALDDLREKLAAKLFVNFSLFQSLPDVWGIGQIFPIVPIEHLNCPLTRRAIIKDITCDSDGRIDQYVEGEGLETTLPLPDEMLNKNKVLAFCLVGAYQEILGDMHNLFGDSEALDVEVAEDGRLLLFNRIQGDSIQKVLEYVNYDIMQLKQSVGSYLQTSELKGEEIQEFIDELLTSFSAYTYLDDEG